MTQSFSDLSYLQFDIQWASIGMDSCLISRLSIHAQVIHAPALLFYDYALTFPLELRYIWGEKYQHAVVPYIFCRYALLANVLYLLAIAGKLSARVSRW